MINRETGRILKNKTKKNIIQIFSQTAQHYVQPSPASQTNIAILVHISAASGLKKTHFTVKELFLQDLNINQYFFVAQTVEQDFSIVKVMWFESQGMNKLTNWILNAM